MRYGTLLIVLLSGVLAYGSQSFVTMANIFLGEVASNLTAGAPLSVSIAGKVASGIANQEISSTTAYTCGATAGTITGMTVTPVAGTYLVVYSSDFASTVAGYTAKIYYSVGGTALAISTRNIIPEPGGLGSGNGRVSGGLNSIIALNGSQALTVTCIATTGTVTTANSQMDLVRLQ